MARKNGNHSKSGQGKRGKRKHYSPISNSDLETLHADFKAVAYTVVTPLPENEDSPELDKLRRTQLKNRAKYIFEMVSTIKAVKDKCGLDLFGYVARASELEIKHVKKFKAGDWINPNADRIQNGVRALLHKPLVNRFNLSSIIVAFHSGHAPHPRRVATARDLRK